MAIQEPIATNADKGVCICGAITKAIAAEVNCIIRKLIFAEAKKLLARSN